MDDKLQNIFGEEKNGDELLDAALGTYASAEPRDGLELRMAARVHTSQPDRRHGHAHLLRWLGAPLSIAMLGIVLLIILPGLLHRQHRTVTRSEEAISSATTPRDVTAVNRRSEVAHGAATLLLVGVAKPERPNLRSQQASFSRLERRTNQEGIRQANAAHSAEVLQAMMMLAAEPPPKAASEDEPKESSGPLQPIKVEPLQIAAISIQPLRP